MRVLLVGMGGLYNRGCEAIVWGSVPILQQVWPGAEVTVAVGYPDNAAVDRQRLPALPAHIIPMYQRQMSGALCHRIARRIAHALTANALLYSAPLAYEPGDWDLVLDVGGDTLVGRMGIHRLRCNLRRRQYTPTPMGLWGMNLEPEQWSQVPRSFLRQAFSVYDVITVRDQTSLEYLRDLGVAQSAFLMADPAFGMLAEPWPVEQHLPEENGRALVGLNYSPLAASLREGIEGGIEFVHSVAQGLLDRGFGVLLVPHCFPPACPHLDDDMTVLAPAYERLSSASRRLGILPAGISSPQVKHAVSMCEVFVGARMHSTIAAWSLGIPVLTLSYSGKSRRLNDEIYGHQDYLVAVAQVSALEVVSKVELMADNLVSARAQTATGAGRMRERTQLMIAALRDRAPNGRPVPRR